MSLPTFYFPGNKFPSVSVTGAFCALQCAHCNGHYLKGMIECGGPEHLIELAKELEANGANGFLLSGGCDSRGRIPLERFYPAVREIKGSSDLTVNLHIGLIDPRDAKEVADSEADVVSVEVIGDDDTIREVYNLEASVDDYEIMLTSLRDAGANVVPHITAGLHFGKLKGEERALSMMEKVGPRTIVVNALIPTKDTGMEDVQCDAKDYLYVLSSARKRFPDAMIVMGCMRPRDKEVEREALKMGIDGIVNPNKKTAEEFRHEKNEVCCAVPL
ncbi:MAG: radical SAM protein [Thermoplasmata archaeon]|nr:radical SAM protein [Thermoplasmata archaeon]